MREAIAQKLSAFTEGGSTRERAEALFNVLGYYSTRKINVGRVDEFAAYIDSEKTLSEKQRRLFDSWHSVDIVFQVTGEEIGNQVPLFHGFDFDEGHKKSFLFLAVPLKNHAYGKTELAEMTRIVNRGFKMPVIVLFQYGPTLTLAAVHRRAHRQGSGQDVLERVTLVKDIRANQPHRAHLDILSELALPRLIEAGVSDFDSLHAAWERVLDIETLNQRFYRELFKWFQRTLEQCRFPDDKAGQGSLERHVIRLVTRLLFIWFMKEKGLAPARLFKEDFAHEALNHHALGRTDYYRAILQNLFFATLNTKIDRRAFSSRTNATHRDFTRYRYRSLLKDAEGFREALKQVPFVNGGLFDCLDDFAGGRQGGGRIDAFTDNIKTQGRDLDVPARLFLDEHEGLFPLLRRYKFTVEESTPIDQEVALDPELLGRVFENLLAAYNPETRDTVRKATGSYYTPRRVVDYMAGEALAEALSVKCRPTVEGDEFWRDRLNYLLDHSIAKADAGDFFEEGEKRAIVAAITDLKVLDPAVGSGAFPMSILQKLTLALRRLDPGNTLWETFQKERAKARAEAAFDTGDQGQREEELREISDTFEKYRESDYGRKLYLIQNSIYGVDIQPIACQIARLRFFISLVIEQDQDPGAPNLGIKPLPNLETRFIVADTLLKLQLETAPDLFDNEVQSKRKEITAVRERYFLSDNRSKKREYIKEDKRLRNELRGILTSEERGIRDSTLVDASRVANWNPYDQNARADWFDAEYMFGVTGGFDVVIGNPPYIQLQKDSGRLGKRYESKGYETLDRRGDIYQLFYERACGLLIPGSGVLAFITSNSWLKAEYGKKLRRWFAERHEPLQLIEMGQDVFDAIVDACILLVREGGNGASLPAVDMDRIKEQMLPPAREHWGQARPDGETPWSILFAVEWKVLEKMRGKGTPLKDWDVQINFGIKTGYNEAFIIDDAKRAALITANRNSEEIIKPVLRGRDIRRFRARWAGKWLIATFPSLHIDIDDYPAVKAHLLSYGKERLEQSGKTLQDGSRARSRTPLKWFELQMTVGYHENFTKEKLFWIELADKGRFAYDDNVIFGLNTTFVLTGDCLKFLCAVLNARLTLWFLRHAAPTSGMGTLRWLKVYVETIPIPRISLEEQGPFVQLVDSIIAAKDADPRRRYHRTGERNRPPGLRAIRSYRSRDR